MTRSGHALAGAVALTFLLCGGRAVAQTAQGARSVETISVTGARPVADAMDLIEERYGVLIDYVDPQYAAPEDTESVSYRPGRVTLGPRIQSVSLQYTQYTQVGVKPEGRVPYISCKVETPGCVPAWPERGITALIQQVLDQFASQGGQVFLVRKLEMPYGPRWEVFPEQARDRSGRFVFQSDILDANIYIPRHQRAPGEMLVAICDQLTTRWGHTFGVASAPIHTFVRFTGELGAENVSAREALAELMGRTLVLRLFYAPDDGMYYVNIENAHYRPPPLPRPLPPPLLTKAPSPSLLGPDQWLGRAQTPEGISDVQGALAKAGYLRIPPTTRWDPNASDAIRRFQAASALQPTGVMDGQTMVKLLPYLPMVSVPNAPPSLMYPALAQWLGSTPQGRMEIQQALTSVGFYSGAATEAMSDDEMRAALKAFQTANGLYPHGLLDYQTAEKLAPFLPKPKEQNAGP